MNISKLVILSSVLCLCASAETVEQVIAKARAQLGTEEALKAVKTLRYEGTVDNVDGPSGELTLVFKKPYQQFLQITTDASSESTAVNGYEGWREYIDKVDPYKSGVLVLPPNQVQYLISNALENLYFFEGPNQLSGGKVELEGDATWKGKECWKVNFIYPSGLRYSRYFAKPNAELLVTMTTDDSMEMIEKDNFEQDGIKFPHVVETYRDGELIRTVTFKKIEVNQAVKDSLFDFPGLPTTLKP